MLENQIEGYKKKYYTNKLIKGLLLSSASVLSCFLIINLSEYFSSFNSLSRAVLFFSFLLISILSFVFWIFIPFSKLLKIAQNISNQDAAKQIGEHFPEINDKLLNTLQLKKLSENADTDLIKESINQKEQSFVKVRFSDAVNYSINKKYIKYLAPPFLLTLLIFLFVPQLFTESTPRIINYTKEYKKEALFNFEITNKSLEIFKNEDFELKVKLSGIAIPENISLSTNMGRKLKLNKVSPTEFSYIFKKVQKDINFNLEASGFESDSYKIKVLTRPSLLNFNVFLDYPSYTGKNDNRVENTGNLVVPEGTRVKWSFKTQATEDLSLTFENTSETFDATQNKDNTFDFSKEVKNSSKYQIKLLNQFSTNKDIIEYFLNITPDEFPSISISQFSDTVLYESLVIGGNIGDDYGITRLELRYKIIPANTSDASNIEYQSRKIEFNKQIINQSFFKKLDLKDFSLKNGDELEYYVTVYDNDQVNGSKSTKSSTFKFKLPTKEELKEELSDQSKGTEKKIKDNFKEAQDLSKDIQDIQDKLKGKKKLSWQDKKSLENLIKKSKTQEKNIEQLQKLNELFNQKQENLNLQNEDVAKKAEQLQKLMDELLDEETKKLYEELNKLMEQNFINRNLQELLNDIEIKQENIESELDRALELFKKLKLDAKINEITKELEELSQDQEKLSEETKESKNSELEDIEKKQEELNEKFEDIKKDFEDLEKLNQDTKSPKNLDNFEEQQKNISQEQKAAQEELQQKNQKKASQNQKNSSQQMQQMAQQMQQMQQSAEMQQLNENYDDLRSILENLITLSFNQEELMLEFRNIRRIDPKFVKLSQDQLKIKDDAQLIQDSLLALSKRVFQIESFVTREVNQMNKYMKESLSAIKKRTPEIASSKQQFTMTSVNNLALLLDDILQQMQQQMSQSMSGQQNNEKKSSSPSLSELQKQLNQRLQNLKKSGKSGRQLSEEFAKLAAQQEMIRNAMQQKQQGAKQQGKEGKNGEGGENGYKEMLREMEKTEEDLVNKRLTQETIQRQQEILTRLLESEKAEKERELDNKREAEKAQQNINNKLPQDFLEYIKIKETQVELLKTIPTSLNKYYKKQVNEYFKKLKD